MTNTEPNTACDSPNSPAKPPQISALITSTATFVPILDYYSFYSAGISIKDTSKYTFCSLTGNSSHVQ